MQNVDSVFESGKLTISLSGRIDMNNVEEVRKAVFDVLEKCSDTAPLFDAKKLEYISSAGLRVLLQVGTRYEQPLSIVNVSPIVLEILETTGFTQIMNVKPA